VGRWQVEGSAVCAWKWGGGSMEPLQLPGSSPSRPGECSYLHAAQKWGRERVGMEVVVYTVLPSGVPGLPASSHKPERNQRGSVNQRRHRMS